MPPTETPTDSQLAEDVEATHPMWDPNNTDAARNAAATPAPVAPDAGVLTAPAPISGGLTGQAAQPTAPPVPLHTKIAEGIIHAFAGTDGTAGSALRSALAGGLAGLAAASNRPPGNVPRGAAALGGFGAGATAAVQQSQQQQQQKLENQRQQTAQQMEQTKQDYLHAESTARMHAEQLAANKLEQEDIDKRVSSGKDVAAQYDKHRTAVGTGLTAEDLLPEAGSDGKYSHEKNNFVPTGETEVLENGQMHRVPTFSVYPKNAEDEILTPENAELLKQGGYNYKAGTPINGDLFENMRVKSMAAQTSAALLKKSATDAQLSEDATNAALEKKTDLAAVNPYLGAHPDDPITALGQLSQQKGKDGQPTPAAQSASRLLAGYDEKSLETHRKNMADERLKAQEIEAKKVAAKGNFVGNPDAATSQEFLQSLDPEARSLVTLIGTGKAPINNPGYLVTKKPEILEAVAKAYPEFDTSKIKSYQETYSDFTHGKTATALNAGGTALGHLRELQGLNTNESHIPGTPAYTAYMNKVDTVATELARFYGADTVPGIEAIKKTLTSTLPGNRQAAISTQAKSMGDKLDAYETQWTNAAPSKAYQAPMPGISAAARQARATLDPEYANAHPEFGPQRGNAPPPAQGFTRMNVPGRGQMDIPSANVQAALKAGASAVQ